MIVNSFRTLMTVMVFTVAFSFIPSTVEAVSSSTEKPFSPSETVMEEIDALIMRARDGDKLALIVMGANWCHDSLGLLDHFSDPSLATILDQHYEKLLVDVGELNAGSDVNLRFGLPVIYGTPTVLVVDPTNERLLNANDLQYWYNADSISVEDAVAYFTSKTVPAVRFAASAGKLSVSGTLKRLYDDIDRFEFEQAKRIYRGFEIVGPMVALEQDERPESFYRLWEQLRVLRYRIPDDLLTLRATARRRVALGETDIKLDFPEYPPLEWEVN